MNNNNKKNNINNYYDNDRNNHKKENKHNINYYDNDRNNQYKNENKHNINNYDNRNNQYKNENKHNINNYDNNRENKNAYPTFSMYYNNTENNTGYNNNNFNNNNYKKKDDNLMNELTEVFAKQQIQEKNQTENDLPTYSQLNYANNLKKNNNENDELINYIGNLNNNKPITSTKEYTPLPLNKVNIKPDKDAAPIKEDDDFGFENTVNNEASQIQLNIYNNTNNLENIKKVYVNNSSLKEPQNQDYYDEDNPYKNN